MNLLQRGTYSVCNVQAKDLPSQGKSAMVPACLGSQRVEQWNKSVMTAWKAQEVRGRAAEVLPAQECIEDLSTWFSSAVTAAFCKAVPSEES